MTSRTMLYSSAISTALLTLLAGTTNAQATPRYYPLVEARPIYRRTVTVNKTITMNRAKYVMVSTANLRATPNPRDIGLAPVDTAMVVKNLNTGRSYFNDDCFGFVKSSCLFVPVSSKSNRLQITVFAARALHFGIADVVVNGTAIDRDVEFGGTIINLRVPTRRRGYSFQTVHVPNGADDTQLILFDSAWREKGYDDDTGVGEAAQLWAPKRTGDRLLVGSWSSASRGYTSVVINDCRFHPDSSAKNARECFNAGFDTDKDNLSNDLEKELQTNVKHHDTDGDGLFDYHEAIGRIIGTSEQELKFHGANPRRRDLFIEYDQECLGTVWAHNNNDPPSGPPVLGKCKGGASLKAQARNVALIQESLQDLPKMSPNPDGSTGIFIHADTGQQCAPDAYDSCDADSCASLCGDWGGFDVLALDDEAINAMSSSFKGAQGWHGTTSYLRGFRSAMNPARHGLFFYVWLYRGGGRISAQSKGVVSNSIRAPHGAATELVHEIGHCLGLTHSGDQPGTLVNNSSAYPSTMNYNYQSRLNGVTTRPRFSRGDMQPIDHTSLNESSYSPQVSTADRAYLSAAPLHYDLDVSITSDTTVDFNYDGRINSPDGLPVQFDTAPMTPYGGLGWPDLYQNRALGDAVPTGGGAIAIDASARTPNGRRATVWAFAPFMHSNGAVFPDYNRFANDVIIESTHSGLAHFDGWQAGIPLNGHADGEVAATTFEFAFGRRILLLFPNIDGVMNYRLFDPANPGVGVWAPIPGWVPGSRARQASVTVINGALGSSDDRIDVVFKDISVDDMTEHVYMTNIDVNGNWAAAPVLQARGDGVTMVSYFTPGIVEGPDGYVYMAALHTDLAFYQDQRRLFFLRRAAQLPFGQWERVDALGTSTPTGLRDGRIIPIDKRRRLNLLFLPYLEQGHRPFSDGSGYLAVFYNSGTDNPTQRDWWFHNRIYTTGFISPTQTVYGAPLGRRATVAIDRPYVHHSTAVARRWNDAVSLHTAVEFWTNAPKPMLYKPFANGTPPVSYDTAVEFIDPFGRTASIGRNADTDDAAIMSATMCKAVRFNYGACNCNASGLDATCPLEPVSRPPEPVPPVFK